MAIEVCCRNGHTFSVKDFFAGSTIACRECGEGVQVPAAKGDGNENATSVAREKNLEPTQPATFETPTHRIPTDFGRYQIIKLLGEGGMGEVYLARDKNLDRKVALKIPRFSASSDSQIRERFYREARAAAALHHPHLCPVFDVGEFESFLYMTMLYIQGRSLSDLIKAREPMPETQIATIVYKLALALQVAHSYGVIHLDLKPLNVMIDKGNEPMIMDFGLARRTGIEETGSGEKQPICGSPSFMAPEQVVNDVELIGPGTDIYSLGAILYQLLTSRLPFRGGLHEILAKIVCGKPEAPRTLRPNLDPQLEAICLKAMSKNVEDRFDSMEEFAKALCEFLYGLTQSSKTIAGDGVTQTTAPSQRRLEAGENEETQVSEAISSEAPPVPPASSLQPPASIAEPVGQEDRKESGADSSTEVPTVLTKPAALTPPLAIAPFSADEAKEHQKHWAEYLKTDLIHIDSIGMRLILIPPGEFRMGSSSEEVQNLVDDDTSQTWVERFHSEAPQHLVKITRPFYLGMYEVTVGEFRRFVAATGYQTNPKKLGPSDEHPVVNVSYDDAMLFCQWLSSIEDVQYRLPTEAEWEYGCRAGSLESWCFGDEIEKLGKYAWFGKWGVAPRRVGQKRANGFWLYDMHGNVCEWCTDWFADTHYSSDAEEDPQGSPSGNSRVFRGGAFSYLPIQLRCTSRYWAHPSTRTYSIGFRVAMTFGSRYHGRGFDAFPRKSKRKAPRARR